MVIMPAAALATHWQAIGPPVSLRVVRPYHCTISALGTDGLAYLGPVKGWWNAEGMFQHWLID